jgi:hypothetical protein
VRYKFKELEIVYYGSYNYIEEIFDYNRGRAMPVRYIQKNFKYSGSFIVWKESAFKTKLLRALWNT